MKEIKLKIRIWPDNILRQKCKKVAEVNDQVRQVLSEMLSLMRINKGVGLAANQAGINLQLVVIEAEDRIFKLVNPKIIRKEGLISFNEGCLSFPGLNLDVKRAKRVWVSALNEQGEHIDLEAEGVLAVIFQHEIDHINGVVFIDRVSFFSRLRASVKLIKFLRRKNGLRK